CMQGSQLPLTF
nr:immunoglobulin light chain junction region [Macaca mulatta]